MSSLVQLTRLLQRLHLDTIAQYCRLVWKFEWDRVAPVLPETALTGFTVELCREGRELGIIVPTRQDSDNEKLRRLLETLGETLDLDCFAEVFAFELSHSESAERYRIADGVLLYESTLTFTRERDGVPVSDLYMFHWADELVRAVVRVETAWQKAGV